MIVELGDLKQHLREDGDENDMAIQALGLAAEAMVRSWIGRPFYAPGADMPLPGAAEYHSHQMVADEAIKVAIKMLALRMYEDDRAGGSGAFDPSVPPIAVRALLAGHRVFFTGSMA